MAQIYIHIVYIHIFFPSDARFQSMFIEMSPMFTAA